MPQFRRSPQSRPSSGVGRRPLRPFALLALLAALLTLPLAACGSSDQTSGQSGSTASGKKSIGFDFPENSLPIYADLVRFAQQRAKKYGYDIRLSADEGKQDAEIANVQSWITQGVNAMVVFPLEPTTMESLASQAKQKGLKWVTYGGSMTNQNGAINFSPYQSGLALGENAAKWANDNLGGKGQVALLINETIDLTRQRDKGVMDGFTKNAPNMQIVAKQFANSPQTGLTAANTILTAHPHVNMVLAVNDDGALGAYQAFINRGIDPNDPKIYIGGQDGSQQALETIKKGGIFRATSAVRLRDIGYSIVDLPHKMMTTGKDSSINLPITVIDKNSPDLDAYLSDYS
jgi:ABC-type sugar transport system substrate-binding protein